MTKYGHELLFGAFITPTAEHPERVVALTQLAERVGLDLATFQDHPYQPAFLDTWTLMSYVAAATDRIRLTANVLNLPLRPPAVLARSAASLDRLTGGRIELGLGAGAFWDAIEAVGGRRLTPGQAVDALDEAIQVIRAVWAADQRGGVRVDGEYYRVVGAKRGPAPAHDMEIWLGALKPRMLDLVGRVADGWIPSLGYLPGGPSDLIEMNKRIDEGAASVGRDPSAVRRLLNVQGQFRTTSAGLLLGPVRQWIDELAEIAIQHGISAFILASDDPGEIQKFAEEVAPAVRELVSGGGSSPIRPSNPPIWDESTRPTAPTAPEGHVYSERAQAVGQHLIDVHDHLRGELDQIRDVLQQVRQGALGAGEARSVINEMTMRQNDWTLGAYCATYCRIVTQHHSLEDAQIFPHLRQADAGLVSVIDRLEAEHGVIHEVLEGVDRALVDFVGTPEDFTGLQRALDLLTNTLLSHLAYEEAQIVEPLTRFGFYPGQV